MTKKYFLVLILSLVCLAACSKKEDKDIVADDKPIVAIVDEVSPAADGMPVRPADPLDNVVTKTDMAAEQNLAGDIPADYNQAQAASPAQGDHFADPASRILTGQQPAGAKQPVQPVAYEEQ